MDLLEKLKRIRHWSDDDNHSYDRAFDLMRNLILDQQRQIDELKNQSQKPIWNYGSGSSLLTGNTGCCGPSGTTGISNASLFSACVDSAPDTFYRTKKSFSKSSDPYESFDRVDDDEEDEDCLWEGEEDDEEDDELIIGKDSVPDDKEIQKYVQKMFPPEHRRFVTFGAEWMRKRLIGL